MVEPKRRSKSAGPVRLVLSPQTQLAFLAGLLGAIVLAISFTDLTTGGDTMSPPALGSTVDVTPGTRMVIIPTLVPRVTAAPILAASPTPSTATDALTRDAQRIQELQLLQLALAEYYDRFDAYPDTGGGTQTMCVYMELDKGCELKEVLDDGEGGILEDPLGDPSTNGYWYASDGRSYTIWMLREGPSNPGDPVCSEAPPDPLRKKGSLFCITLGGAPP